MSRLAGILVAVSVVVASPLSTDPLVGPRRAATAQMPLAPVLTPSTPALINGSYIVMFKHGVDAQMMLSHLNFLEGAHTDDPLDADDSGLKHVYNSPTTKGYSGSFTQQTIERIRTQPEVDYIEQDQVVHALGHETQRNAPWVCHTLLNNKLFDFIFCIRIFLCFVLAWFGLSPSDRISSYLQGLSRVSHREKLRFSTLGKYEYDTRGGEGVDVYVIDTGAALWRAAAEQVC